MVKYWVPVKDMVEAKFDPLCLQHYFKLSSQMNYLKLLPLALFFLEQPAWALFFH
jgi:hypothetical protein